MDNFRILNSKLEAFIRRFYTNELIKGGCLFVALGLFYFIFTLVIEYFLWLEPFGRQILFWLFVLVESILFIKFIVFPLLQLFKISKGINYEDASRIIGDHFPEVKDKLLNVLQLKKISQESELLLAGIDQKARELHPVPFKLAVNFNKNLSLVKYAAIPVMIIVLVYLSGKSSVFSESYERVIHYKMAYQPPAPFKFQLLNTDLSVRENEAFKLQVRVVGSIVPENASIHYHGQTYFLQEKSPGLFEYTFEPISKGLDFHFSGNKVVSNAYSLEVVEVPRMLDFEMILDFPTYTGIKDEIKKGSGNATIPEGTKVKWELKTSATTRVSIQMKDTILDFEHKRGDFFFEKRMYNDSNYKITTSNGEVKKFEQLAYSLKVIKDQYPELKLERKKDSVALETWYFQGKVSDDYGVSKVRLIVYPKQDPKDKIVQEIPISAGTFSQFFVSFPDTLNLEKGVAYEYYFEVFDNDALHNHKSVKSKIFSFQRKTDEELQEAQLTRQNKAIDGLTESLEEMGFSEEELQEITQLQRQKGAMDYNGRKKLKNFLERQKRQNELMKGFSDELKKSLEKINPEEEDHVGRQLRERLDRREERLEKNEELLEKLEEYASKISKEELAKELEKLSKNTQNQQKNLEQLLELTKRYYVEEKNQKVANALEKLGEKQKSLSESGAENTKQNQDSLNQEFNRIKQEIAALKNENKNLKEPMELGLDKAAKKEITKEQKEASENLGKENRSQAKKNQNKAAEKMKALSANMKKQRAMSAGMQMGEDIDMLRQILDNLLTFSFEQEAIMADFKAMRESHFAFADKLKQQNALREHFEHVDDSLYALALRNPMLTEKVTGKLTNIEFDLNKALERLAQNKIRKGLSSQQYVISGANDLAYFLSRILESMEQKMNPSGKGGGSHNEIQLPDIIKKQQGLNEKMKEGLRKKQNEMGKQKMGKGKNEVLKGELYEIFKEQQLLRKALEDKLGKVGLDSNERKLQEEMKQIEKDLLKKGFNPKTLKKMLNMEHKLLDLKDAKRNQGRSPKRESDFNKREFENRAKDQIIKAKEYFNSTEILNRQSLPLRQIYKRKVKEYFERGDH